MNIYNITATLIKLWRERMIKDVNRQVVANDVTHAAWKAGQFHDIDKAGAGLPICLQH